MIESESREFDMGDSFKPPGGYPKLPPTPQPFARPQTQAVPAPQKKSGKPRNTWGTTYDRLPVDETKPAK